MQHESIHQRTQNKTFKKKLHQIDNLKSHIEDNFFSNGFNSANFANIPGTIDTSEVLITEYGNNHFAYTFRVIQNEPTTMINLVIIEENNVFSVPHIFEMKFTNESATSINNGNKSAIAGVLRHYLSGTDNQSGFTEITSDCGCFHEYISLITNTSTGDNGGNDGSGGNNSGNNNNNNNGNNSGTTGPGNTGFQMGPGGGGDCPEGFYSLQITMFFGEQRFTLNLCIVQNIAFAPRDPRKLATRSQNECERILQGMGLLANSNGGVNPPYQTDDPFQDGLADCRLYYPAAAALINQYKNTSFIDACEGKEINIDWDRIEMELCFGCQNGGSSGFDYSTESVEKMLEMHTRGKVVFQIEDMPPGCPYLNCILNKIRNGTLYQPFVNVCGQNINGNIHGIKIKFETTYASDQPWNAGFSDKGSDGYYSLRFNSSKCNNYPNNIQLITYETLVHEIYHGIIASKLEKIGWNGTTATKNFYIQQLILIDGFFGQATNEHEYMLLKYLEDWVNLIYSMNDNKLERDLYLALVLNGFGDNYIFIENTIGKNIEWIDSKLNELLNLITAPNNDNVSQRFINCN